MHPSPVIILIARWWLVLALSVCSCARLLFASVEAWYFSFPLSFLKVRFLIYALKRGLPKPPFASSTERFGPMSKDSYVHILSVCAAVCPLGAFLFVSEILYAYKFPSSPEFYIPIFRAT